MPKNLFQNLMLVAIAVLAVAFGLATVKAVDMLRFKVERVERELEGVKRRLGNLARAGISSSKAAESAISPAPVANAEFYDPAAAVGGFLTSAIAAETKNMNYLVNNEAFVSSLWSYCNDSLTERDWEHPEVFEPQLAESWELSDDKKTYTIRLRRGIKWHDFTDPVTGRQWRDVELTAHDFKFYVDAIKNPDTDCAPSRVYLKDLERVEVLSDYEFMVFWGKKYFMSESITLGLSPLPRHLYHAYDGPFDGKRFNDDHQRNRMIVGCGPYRFDRWEKGRKVVLSKFDNYYGRALGVDPPLGELAFEVITHPNTRLQALRSGGVDRFGMLPEQWVETEGDPRFDPDTGDLRKLKYPSRSYSYIGYNLKNPLFADARVRRAMTHLINREKILDDVLHGLGRIVTGNFFVESPYYDHDIKPYEFSVGKAAALLAEAGWSDGDGDGILDKDGVPFKFTILAVSNHPVQDKMLPLIKEDMAKAGVVMNIARVEWSVYVQRLEKKKFDVCTLGWSMGFESDPYQIWHSSQAEEPNSSNHIGFSNPEADRLIEEIRTCFDLKRRVELCHQFHRLLHAEQPYTFLFSRDALTAQNGRYRNVRILPVGLVTKIMWDSSAE